jgi:hypothetical protein
MSPILRSEQDEMIGVQRGRPYDVVTEDQSAERAHPLRIESPIHRRDVVNAARRYAPDALGLTPTEASHTPFTGRSTTARSAGRLRSAR